MTIAQRYVRFAEREARGVSPSYERLARSISRDEELLSLLGTLPEAKQQPNLLFGVVRLLGGPVDDPAAFRGYTFANWSTVEAEVRTRVTQTNEAGRCAVLLPLLAALPQPLALLEVGASAGLCLYPDRYAYRYAGSAPGGHLIGTGEPVLDEPGSPMRGRWCCRMKGCRNRRATRTSTCSRSTGSLWPGLAGTVRRSPGSASRTS